MAPAQIDQPGKRSKKPFIFGCLGGGCLAFIIGLIAFTLYWFSWVKSVPEEAPTVEAPPFAQEKFDALGARYDTFRTAVERGAEDEFVFTEEDLNLCLGKWAKERDDAARMIVRLDGADTKGRASIPVTMEDGSRKWVNCEFEVTVGVADGRLDLQIKELKIKDKTFADTGIFAKPIDELKEDTLKKFHDDPAVRKQLDKVESVVVKEGAIHVKVKPGAQLDAMPAK